MQITSIGPRLILDQRLEIFLQPTTSSSSQLVKTWESGIVKASLVSDALEDLQKRAHEIRDKYIEDMIKDRKEKSKNIQVKPDTLTDFLEGAAWGATVVSRVPGLNRVPWAYVAGGIIGGLLNTFGLKSLPLEAGIAHVMGYVGAIAEEFDKFIDNAARMLGSSLEQTFNNTSQIFAQMESSLQQLSSGFGGFGGLGGGGDMFAGLGGLFGGLFGGGAAAGADASLGWGSMGMEAVMFAHGGGVIGEGGLARYGHPFPGGAQRFHRGGFPGLAANEVPAILQRGEEVLTRRDLRHRANLAANLSARSLANLSSGMGRGRETQNVNVTYNIDARGADAGVEARIKVAMRETEKRTLAAVNDLANRGGKYSKTLGRRQQR
ncbi:MAG: hypothetical protein AB7M05_08905 [Alphaproteobacteria bacterium]